MKIAIVTAGGAGMFCGSCMQDNTLARTLSMAGHDAVLVPTYTPIRVDEENASTDRVFLGGVNVYLDSQLPGWKFVPRTIARVLDHPTVLRMLTKFGGSTDASKLGSLTLDMLRGDHGPQRREFHEFATFLCEELRPDVIIFSNALISGVAEELRSRYDGRMLCLLQGDDIFLEALDEKWRPKVLQQVRQNIRHFDGFLAHSNYYRDFMSGYLGIAHDAFRVIPLTIDVDASSFIFDDPLHEGREFRIGYFARICPEKGVHNFLAAAERLLPEQPAARMVIAGYLPEQHRGWFEGLLAKLPAAVAERVEYLGSPDSRDEKFRTLQSFDLLCVPTDYQEPKGLYVLEAGLVGVPALLPRHGAFPELLERLQCGFSYDSGNAGDLSDSLNRLVHDGVARNSELSRQVREQFGMAATGPIIGAAIESFS